MPSSKLPQKLSLYSKGISLGKLELLDDYISPGKVLDIGCGNGLYDVHLQNKCCHVLQTDLTDRRHDGARHLPSGVMYTHNLNFRDNEFDHVIAFDIMEHLDDDVAFLNFYRTSDGYAAACFFFPYRIKITSRL